MNKAYIILVHKNPDQLYRLIRRLDDGRSTFFIHIDKKVPMKYFLRLHEFGEKVVFVNRTVCNRACFGAVRATLNALQAIKQHDIVFERICLLSGQDYPIKSNATIDQYFATSFHSNLLEYYTPPDFKKRSGGGAFQINKYFFGFKAYQRLAAKAFNFLSMVLPVGRKLTTQLIPYAGSQWWILDRRALNYILDFVEKNPSYVSFHKFTFAPDELFFHTILLNSEDPQLLNSIVNTNKRYMKRSGTKKGRPEILVKDDFHELERSDALFARKFDIEADSEILDLIDERCLKYDPHLPVTYAPTSIPDINRHENIF